MKEKAILLGQSQTLLGIVTQPAESESPASAFILLNSGNLHRVGPNRIYVKLARRLAEKGFPVIRFDLSGIGDSKIGDHVVQSGDGGVQADVQVVMDYMSGKYGAEKFVLLGLCSGADHAFRVAALDERVAGAVMIEPFSFPTTGYFAQSYQKSFFKWRSWKRLLSGQSEIWNIMRGLFIYHTSKQTRQLTENWEVPSKEQISGTIKLLVERGVKLQLVYSSGGSGHYHYDRLLSDSIAAVSPSEQPDVAFLDDTDHLFTPLADQTWLLNKVLSWSEAFYTEHEVELRGN